MKIARVAAAEQLDKEIADKLVEYVMGGFAESIAGLQRQLNERNGKPRDYLIGPMEHLGTFKKIDGDCGE